MDIIDLFYRGEPLYMSILTLLFFIIIIMALTMGIPILRSKVENIEHTRRHISYIKSVGLFTLIFGVFVQLLGLYGAFIAIRMWGSITPEVLATGLWTSSIPNFYGIFIFLVAYLLWFVLNARLKKIKIGHL